MKARMRLGIVGGVIVAIIGIHYAGFGRWVLDQIQEQRDRLKYLVHVRYFTAVFGYIVMYALAMSCAIPVGAVLTLTGGYLFGTVLGALYALIGAVCGGSGIFILVRKFFGRRLQKRYAYRLHAFNNAIQEHGAMYLLVIRFIVVIPYSLVNVLAGLTKISFTTFIWTTLIGLIPSMLVYTFAGHQLTRIESLYDVFSVPILCVFIFLVFLALVPIGIRSIKRKYESMYDAK